MPDIWIGVGVGVGAGAVMVMSPLLWPDANVFRSASTNTKLFGGALQTNGLAEPGVLLTLSILRLNNVPDPVRGVKLCEMPDRRRVLIGPGPGRMPAERFQPLAVSPAAWIAVAAKVTTDESKVKSP